jgi:hypothetical protein
VLLRQSFRVILATRDLSTRQMTRSIAARFGVHPHRIYAWKKALVQAAPRVFADHLGPSDELSERKLAALYEQLGRVLSVLMMRGCGCDGSLSA